ncbi:MAG: HD family phosphohydrolase [Stigonema ocellatum SAG 48.90 = DSM 106950]|nr:HD family phosphohydrolase [Stigonema ocellatum SAG 48.90 = DSM 106950]
MKRGIYAVGLGWVCGKPSIVIFVIAVLSLTGVMGDKLYNQPQLKVGTTAPQTMKAPANATIEDKKKTEAQRQSASTTSIPILMVDRGINEEINQNLQQLLSEGNEIRSSVGSFPFFNTSVLSRSTQHYLRSCSNWEWQALLLTLEDTRKQNSRMLSSRSRKGTAPQGNSVGLGTLDAKPLDLFQKVDFTQAMAELEAYRLSTSKQNWSSLIQQISKARLGYATEIAQILQAITLKRETPYNETSFLDLSDEEWAKTQVGIQQSEQLILGQGIPPGLPSHLLQNTVSLHVQTLVPKNGETLATKLLLTVLKPNLKTDRVRTTLQATQAAALVKPVMVLVHQDEVIVRKGEKITAWQFDVLDHYHLIRREIKWLGFMHLASFVTSAVCIFAFIEQQSKCQLRQRDRLLVLLLTLSTPVVLTMGTPYTTWSAVGLLLGSYYGSVLSVTVVGLLVLLLPISLEISKVALLAGAAGGVLASCMAQRLRSREELAILGIAIALIEGGVYLLSKVLLGRAFGLASYIVLQEAALFALSGLAWSVVALGLSPYLEKLFDLVTPIRLAELANPNRPLLKRLATVAPGTFQHTMFVATLAEAAAKQLGCNVELVRAGTLYHDIGKMHDPLAFIENQMGGPNKHDTVIKDPWKSAKIIKKHVTEGLVMARKHSLPTAIQAFIPQHQGTMHIAYFYHQAQQMALEDPTLKVMEADFRYDGPTPQSRETGIVMLADSCEAALRSLKDATPEQALVMLNNILRARWQDNQMVDSKLTREEMNQIAEIFVQVWQQFHHKRIAYPKSR